MKRTLGRVVFRRDHDWRWPSREFVPPRGPPDSPLVTPLLTEFANEQSNLLRIAMCTETINTIASFVFVVPKSCDQAKNLSMNRNELFRLQKAEQDALRANRLDLARAEAHADGKELFDLQVMDALWRDNPDMRMMAQGLTMSLEERIAEWSEKYYVQYPEVRTMDDFVAKMKVSQLHGFFD